MNALLKISWWKINYIVWVVFILALILTSCASISKKFEADKAFNARDYALASQKYEELAQDLKDWKLQIRLGYSYLKTGAYDKSINAFNQATSYSAYAEPWATFYKGLAYLNKGERAKAIEAWEKFQDQNRLSLEREVGKEMRGQKTLLAIEESEKLAKQAIQNEEKLQHRPPESNSLAILEYRDLTPEKRFQAANKALCAMMITDLSKVKSLKLVERIKLQALIQEVKLGKSGLVDKNTAPRFGRLAGAEKLVIGTIGAESIQVANSLASTPEKRVLGSFALQKPEKEFFQLEKEIVLNILNLMKVRLSPDQEKEIRPYHTQNVKAFLHYGQGLIYFDERDFGKARKYFEMAVQQDPNFSLAKTALENCPGPAAMNTILGIPPENLKNMEEMMGMPIEGSACGN